MVILTIYCKADLPDIYIFDRLVCSFEFEELAISKDHCKTLELKSVP